MVLALGLFFIIFIVTLVFLALFTNLSRFQAAVLLSFVSYFPLSYLAYQLRSAKHRARVMEDVNLLGIVRQGEEQAIIDQYDKIYSPQQYLIYVSLASLVTLLGFGLLHFNPLVLSPYMTGNAQTVAMTMFYSFLGAFVYSIYNIYRRFVTFDLQPVVYMYQVIMVITVIIFGFILSNFLNTSSNTAVIVPVVAFLIGYLPDVGLNLIISLSSRVVGKINRRETGLASIDGISIWHEARLRESGIDNVQNLAACDVREILLSSRFNAEQLMNWIDQAILVSTVTQPILRELHQYGLNTITAFRAMVELAGYTALPDLTPELLGKPRQDTPGLLGRWRRVPSEQTETQPDPGAAPAPDGSGALPQIHRKNQAALYQAIYYSADTSPNFYYVFRYWNAVKLLRTRQVATGLKRATQEHEQQIVTSQLSDPDVAMRMGQAWSDLNLPLDLLPDIFPDTTAGQVALGNVYITLERYGDAITILSNAISLDSKYAPAYASRGIAYAMQRLYPEASADFQKAKLLSPDYAVTYHHEGVVLMKQGLFREALAALSQAVQKDSYYALAFYNRGRARFNLGELDEALLDFTTAIRLNPKFDAVYLERGAIYNKQVLLRQAIDDFSKAIQLNRDNASAYARRGQAYLLFGDANRALYDLNTALEIDPNLALAYANRGQLNLQLEDEDSAIEDFTKALQLDPSLVEVYRNRAAAHEKSGELQQAKTDYQLYLQRAAQPSDAAAVLERLEMITQLLV